MTLKNKTLFELIKNFTAKIDLRSSKNLRTSKQIMLSLFERRHFRVYVDRSVKNLISDALYLKSV
jgi:hypothetical protein